MKERDIIYKEEQAKEKIRQYFGKALVRMKVTFIPSAPAHELYTEHIEVAYRDFKPMRKVREELEAMFTRPYVTIERTFSDKALKRAVRHIRWEHEDVTEAMLDDADFLCEVEAWLYGKDLHKSE